ncbi:MAG TPA: RNA polymerase sigma factor [Solirubrobacterales bacterium]
MLAVAASGSTADASDISDRMTVRSTIEASFRTPPEAADDTNERSSSRPLSRCKRPMRLLNPQSLVEHRDRLHRAARALCSSRQDAEDLVQETFTRVLARPRLLRGEASDLAYLMRVLHNTFLSGRRDASRRPRVVVTLEDVQVLDLHATQAPHQALEVRELYAAIAELPERYRLALVAVDLLGLSYRETGRSLGVCEATVATRVFRARRLLVGRLAEEEMPTPEGAELPSAA